jgi:hypothetical protein
MNKNDFISRILRKAPKLKKEHVELVVDEFIKEISTSFKGEEGASSEESSTSSPKKITLAKKGNLRTETFVEKVKAGRGPSRSSKQPAQSAKAVSAPQHKDSEKTTTLKTFNAAKDASSGQIGKIGKKTFRSSMPRKK